MEEKRRLTVEQAHANRREQPVGRAKNELVFFFFLHLVVLNIEVAILLFIYIVMPILTGCINLFRYADRLVRNYPAKLR